MREAALVAARAAAEAAGDAGVLDTCQQEALNALVEAGGDPDLAPAALAALAGGLSELTWQLVEATQTLVRELGDDDRDSDLEELAAMVAEVGDRVQQTRRRASADGGHPAELYASARWLAAVDSAVRHLKESRDHLDDGMPSDAAALEAMAAERDLLKALGQ